MALLSLGMLAALPISAGLAAAQDNPGEADPTFDALRALVPPSFPGEYDLTAADEEYGKFTSMFGESTAIPDFGSGSKLTGVCGGFAFSYDSNEVLLDAAYDAGDNDPPIDVGGSNLGDQAFTAGNPFEVDTNGVVLYFGFMPRKGDGPLDHRWEIKTQGISLDRGGDPNPHRKNRNVGIVDLANDLPGALKANFKAKISGRIDDAGGVGPCVGEGHVQFNGPFLNVISAAGLAMAGLGIFGLLFNSRPAYTWKA